jgi:hypothetical protein
MVPTLIARPPPANRSGYGSPSAAARTVAQALQVARERVDGAVKVSIAF